MWTYTSKDYGTRDHRSARHTHLHVYVWRFFVFNFFILMGHIAAAVLNNKVALAFICYILVFVPILGIWAVHKYNWQHWQPFDKKHKS